MTASKMVMAEVEESELAGVEALRVWAGKEVDRDGGERVKEV